MKKIMKFFASLVLFLVLMVILVLGYRNYQALKQVHRLDAEIDTAVKAQEMEDHRDLVAAIILTESKGKGIDVMQSSESRYGDVGAIGTTQESIDVGVAYLKEALTKAKAAGVDQATAIQAYNFGLDYIDYVQEHGGKNSVKLADQYSKEVLSPMLGNTQSSKYHYWGIHSLMYNGGYLYHNGGNFFYADLVSFNQWKLTHTKFLF